PAVNGGVQGLDASAQDLGEARDVGDGGRGHAGLGERAQSVAGRDDLEAHGHQAARQVIDPRLVGDADQGAAGRASHGYSSVSSAGSSAGSSASSAASASSSTAASGSPPAPSSTSS